MHPGMKRIVLFHWNAEEAAERAARLSKAGYEADCFSKVVPDELRRLGERAPAAVVIDLTRLPSHGREVAGALRRQRGTRAIPIVFVGGAPEKLATVRKLLPDAVYAEWDGIGEALRQATANPPAAPVVPGTMAGYSGTPLPKKLGIRPGAVVVLLDAPKHFKDVLGELPEGARLRRQTRGPAQLVLLFCRSRAELHRRLPTARSVLAEKGGLWIIWPKKGSALEGDLTQAAVRERGLAAGMVDYKICAVDETWSGLLFTPRRYWG